MRKKKESKIPKFKTYEEEANFWDTHDFTEFEDEAKEVDMVFQLEQPKEETLIVRLQKDVKKRLVKVAKQKGVGISALARLWIMERLKMTNRSLSAS